MPQSLLEEFKQTADDLRRAFPRKLRRLVMLSPQMREEPVYISPAAAAELTVNVESIRRVMDSFADLEPGARAIAAADPQLSFAGAEVPGMVVDLDIAAGDGSADALAYARFVRDHEAGHLILKNGHIGPDIADSEHEAAADAFAALLHIRRGGDSEYVRHLAARRARSIILLSDEEHYTPRTLNAVADYAEQNDISGLTLRETAALAEKLSRANVDTLATIARISDAFYPVYDRLAEKIGGSGKDVLRALAEGGPEMDALLCAEVFAVIQQHKDDADIVYAGRTFFAAPKLRDFVDGAAKTDPAWRAAREFLYAAPLPGPLSKTAHARGVARRKSQRQMQVEGFAAILQWMGAAEEKPAAKNSPAAPRL